MLYDMSVLYTSLPKILIFWKFSRNRWRLIQSRQATHTSFY